MRRLFFTIIFFITLISRPAYAQTEIPMPSLTPTPTPSENIIEYELPYPGVLPGSFLYNLKAIRDKITEIVTTDPLKKSSFYLHQADKRLAASLMLFEKGEQELAETTLSKGQNYIEKSLEKAIQAKETEANAGELMGKIETSLLKQKQEIKTLIKTAKGETRQKLKGDLKRAQELEKRVSEQKPK